MRGEETRQPSFVFVGSLEERIPANHPLRPIREMTDKALSALSPLFDEIYAGAGRPSIPPRVPAGASGAGVDRRTSRSHVARKVVDWPRWQGTLGASDGRERSERQLRVANYEVSDARYEQANLPRLVLIVVPVGSIVSKAQPCGDALLIQLRVHLNLG